MAVCQALQFSLEAESQRLVDHESWTEISVYTEDKNRLDVKTKKKQNKTIN